MLPTEIGHPIPATFSKSNSIERASSNVAAMARRAHPCAKDFPGSALTEGYILPRRATTKSCITHPLVCAAAIWSGMAEVVVAIHDPGVFRRGPHESGMPAKTRLVSLSALLVVESHQLGSVTGLSGINFKNGWAKRDCGYRYENGEDGSFHGTIWDKDSPFILPYRKKIYDRNHGAIP